MPQLTHRLRTTAATLLVVSYVLIVLIVGSIGLVVEHDSNKAQDKVCASLRVQILTSAAMTLYWRSLTTDVPLDELPPTVEGQKLRVRIEGLYRGVCGNVPLSE